MITPQTTDSFKSYLKEIKKYKVLTQEEELELFRKIKEGDKTAKDKLICSNLRFVVSIAKQYQGFNVDIEDLVNEGNLGLIHAVDKFDETLGFKFISYAVWWIRQQILKVLMTSGKFIKTPINAAAMINRINKIEAEFEMDNARKPSLDELAEILDISTKRLAELMEYKSTMISLDSPLNDDADTLLYETIPSKIFNITKNTDKESLNSDLDDILKVLTKKERQVINLIFGLSGETLDIAHIADRLNISTERVLQIKNSAINKLRSLDNIDSLRKYL